MTTSTVQPSQPSQGDNRVPEDRRRPSKKDSEDDEWASHGHDYLNPFVHRVEIDNPVEMAKIYVLTVLLLPVRLFGCMISLITAWMFACVGTYGYTLEDLKAKPIAGWRKYVQTITASCMRMVFASGSFHYITQKGERASPKVAPILVVAPHSSYMDSIIVVTAGPPSIVAKRDTSEIPLLGKIINFAQPIYVQREDPNSRQNTIREIVDRARSEEDWPQVVIFAEGTCTNRKTLIKFKPGAFYPGVPVQPVLLKYPNKYDTFTWTWDGPGVIRLLWLTLAQFYNRCEIEYLPVYHPSEEEKSNANLYAKNVRTVMARALDVPTSEYSFEDVILMNRARDMRIPYPGDIAEFERLLSVLGLFTSDHEIDLCARFQSIPNSDKLDVITFSELLNVDLKNTNFHKLFALLDHHRCGRVNLRSYLLCTLFCKLKNEQVIELMKAVIPLYSTSSERISRPSFCKIMRHSSKQLTCAKLDALFCAIDQSRKGCISFADFEAHTKALPQFNYLYRRNEPVRRKLE